MESKQYNVVLLPQETSTGIWSGVIKAPNGQIAIGHLAALRYDDKGQYLYIIDSSAEIQERDWFYVKTKNISGGNKVAQSIGNGDVTTCWSSNILTVETDEKGYDPSHLVKVIATNDPKCTGLPSITTQDIQRWIDEGTKEVIQLEIEEELTIHNRYEYENGGTRQLKLIDNYVIPVWKEQTSKNELIDERQYLKEDREYNETGYREDEEEDIYDAVAEYRRTHPEPIQDSIEQMAEEWTRKICKERGTTDEPHIQLAIKLHMPIFIAGYNSNPGKYTEGDMINAYWGGLNGSINDYTEAKEVCGHITGIKAGQGAQKWLEEYNKTK